MGVGVVLMQPPHQVVLWGWELGYKSRMILTRPTISITLSCPSG